MPIETACPKCTKVVKAKEELAGKRVKCPACATPFVIGPAKKGGEPPSGLHSLFDEVFEERAKPGESACPSCGRTMVADAVVCVGCGYDARSGRQLRTKRYTKGK